MKERRGACCLGENVMKFSDFVCIIIEICYTDYMKLSNAAIK